MFMTTLYNILKEEDFYDKILEKNIKRNTTKN